MDKEINIILEGSAEFGDQEIAYKVIDENPNIFIEASFVKSGKKNNVSFEFEKKQNDTFLLNDKTSKIDLEFDLKDKNIPIIKTENIPTFGNLSLNYDKNLNEFSIKKDDKELINLTKHNIAENGNVNLNKLLLHFKKQNSFKSFIVVKVLNEINNAILKKMNMINSNEIINSENILELKK